MGKGVRRLLSGLGCLVLGVIVLCVLIPALASTRERVPRISCANNLKCIGLGIKMYAGDHDEVYPDKLVKARRYVAHQSALFICPASGNEAGPIETVDEWTEYAYISGLSETSSPDKVLAYCPAKNHRGEGGNVLFADGHIEWFSSKNHCGEDEDSFEEVIGTIGERRKP